MICSDDLKAQGTGRTWNYRAIRFEHGEDSYVAIHEVYYEDGRPIAFSESPAPVMWVEAEGLGTGFSILRRMDGALRKPVLADADFRGSGDLEQGAPADTTGPAATDEPLAVAVLVEVDGPDVQRSAAQAGWLQGIGRASPDFCDELLRSESADCDNMPAVGRERIWLPAANRYPLKTLTKPKQVALGPARPMKGTREAKRANMRRRLKQSCDIYVRHLKELSARPSA